MIRKLSFCWVFLLYIKWKLCKGENKWKDLKKFIEITNVCNLSCNFCPKTGRKLQFSDEEKFKEIIEKVKPYTDHVYFHLMGEPLLNKNLARFLEICYENGLKVNITTNGTLLEKEKDSLINAKALRF